MKRFLSLLLVFVMCVSACLTANAAVTVPSTAKAVFTMSSDSCYIGETVEVDISLACSEAVNSIALSGFSYDTEALEFVSFSDYEDAIKNQMVFEIAPDADKMALTIPLKSATKLNGKLCTMTFKVKSSATEGTYTISATSVTKNGSNVVEGFVVPSEIIVTEKPKANFTGLSLSNKTYTYDGTEKSIAVVGTLPQGASVVYENEKATDAGTYNVKAVVSAEGYNNLTLNAVLKIEQKALTVSGLAAQNKTYDGTKNATITGGSLNGVVSGDSVTATYPRTGTFAKADVGTGIVVDVEDVVLSGADKNNYKLTQPSTLKANITKAVLKVKADDKNIVKGSAVPALTYTITEGQLFGADTLTGSLATAANGSKVGTFDITQGTLKASSNYNLTFTKGRLTVVDKTVQNISVSEITAKTYGDASFKLNVTPDATSGLAAFTFTSSNPSVAEIDSQGNVTIKAAGSTDITVKQAGNDEYAPFEKKQTLTVNKVAITVTADAKTKKVGTSDPELTYTYTGTLVGTDAFTGAITRKPGETVGTYDILQGTLALTNNYTVTYNKGVFEIVDKTPQNIVVDGVVTEKTYGDEGFKVTVTPDATSKLDNFTMTSSNTDVATIDEAGNVVIKNAGSTEISVKEAGNADYAAFEKKWTLNVKKVAIVVTADNKFKKIGQADPEFTYTYTGELVGSDEFTGALTRKTGEEIGKYDILIGSLALTDNYTITYNKGVFEILDKTPQIIALADIDAKTYGDASFKVVATADTESKLDVFTYESDNTTVATVDAEGNVTIIGVGKANIIVKQAGNDEYAAASASKELVVNKKNITLTDVDLTNKTATFEGVLETDISAVGIDFDKIDSVVNSETSKAVVSNFVLTGDKSANYSLTTKEIEKDVVISAGTITAPENVTITVQKAEGTKTVIVSTLDVSALPEETEKVELDMTENGSVDTVSVPKTAFTDLKDKADLEIKLTDGVVKLNKLALTAIEDAANSDKISLKVVKLGDEQLEEVQVTEKNKLTNPVVFGLILSGVTDSLFDGGQATVTVSYEKTGSGNVKVKYLKDDGTTETVSATYDATNKKVTMTLSHFSDYVVYTEPQTYSGGGGGGVSSYTVKFDTNGAETIKNQSIKKNGLVTEPTMPTKDGYTFDGWYTDKELTQKYDFTTKVTKGFTLYAKWTEIEKEPVVDEPDTTITFTDVKENDWFYANVQYVVENKLMNGVAEDKFAPNDTLTRAMLVTVLYRNAGEPAVNKSIPFADVDMGAWYANAVVWAKQNGIVNGVNETDFAPDANITREQIATIMFRYAQYKGMDAVTLEENLHFTDADEISEFAVSAMNWAVGTGLMNGKSATTLNPKDNATRAEIAAILQRFIETNK